MSARLANWSHSYKFGAARVHVPESEEQVQAIVSQSDRVKAAGTRHSFNEIADTSGDLISTERLNRVLSLNASEGTVTVQAGIRYGELCQFLEAEGLALHNLASLPHISVAGAVATATHGSGVLNGSLSSSVVGIRSVSADGHISSLNLGDDSLVFGGSVVALGALGVVIELTLKVEPSFAVTQNVFENLPFDTLDTHFDEIMSGGYSVSLFIHWDQPEVNQVWVKARADQPKPSSDPSDFGAIRATRKHSPVPDGDIENCTDQLGIPGPWFDRLPHFRMGFTPSSGEELQTEYFVDRKDAWEALSAVNTIRDQIYPIIHTTEVRCISADSYWMSPCYERPSVAIHFTWKKDPIRVLGILPKLEELLSPFSARPHWGKLFSMPSDTIQARYPKYDEFRRLVQSMDPTGKFRNPYLDRLLR